MQIRPDPLTDPRVHALLEEHLADMHAWSPACSVHALDLEGLRRPEIAFWSVWRDDTLLGCGALKHHDDDLVEIKSMRTTRAARGQGVGKAILDHLLTEARERGYARVSLETGAQPDFEPARALYRTRGFTECGPFADYTDDPNSVYMTLALD